MFPFSQFVLLNVTVWKILISSGNLTTKIMGTV